MALLRYQTLTTECSQLRYMLTMLKYQTKEHTSLCFCQFTESTRIQIKTSQTAAIPHYQIPVQVCLLQCLNLHSLYQRYPLCFPSSAQAYWSRGFSDHVSVTYCIFCCINTGNVLIHYYNRCNVL